MFCNCDCHQQIRGNYHAARQHEDYARARELAGSFYINVNRYVGGGEWVEAMVAIGCRCAPRHHAVLLRGCTPRIRLAEDDGN